MWGKDSTDVKIQKIVDAFLLTFAAVDKAGYVLYSCHT
jgi:hypothetical protein